MKDRKVIRLVAYLIISIGVMIVIWNLPSNRSTSNIRQLNNPFIRDAVRKDFTAQKSVLVLGLVDSLYYYEHMILLKPGIPVELPKSQTKYLENPISVTIDENSVLCIDSDTTTIDSIEVILQRKMESIEPEKRSFVLKAHKKAPSEKLIYLLDLANKHHWKVGIAKSD